MPYDVIELTQKLISFPSVTPKDEGAQKYLAEKLEALGFECHHLTFSEGDEAICNLFARKGTEAPHLCYAGHTDVVPTGPIEKWKYPPFEGRIDEEEGVLYGRGASDMKGSVAAFVAAVSSYLENNKLKGSLSFLITGDEEGPAINGTVKVIEWMAENGHTPDVCLVGEPSNPDHLGQEIKIGARGAYNGVLTIKGKQGHSAHPEWADNPMPRLIDALDVLNKHIFDEGSRHFPQTNLEITAINVDNTVPNIIPESGSAMFNIRFNDHWTKETLTHKLHEIFDETGYDYDLDVSCNAESFITKPGVWSSIVQKAVYNITGEKPRLTTGGGTSDARFIVRYCPSVECGGVNGSIHMIDENARVDDLKALVKVFEQIIKETDNTDPKILRPTKGEIERKPRFVKLKAFWTALLEKLGMPWHWLRARFVRRKLTTVPEKNTLADIPQPQDDKKEE